MPSVPLVVTAALLGGYGGRSNAPGPAAPAPAPAPAPAAAKPAPEKPSRPRPPPEALAAVEAAQAAAAKGDYATAIRRFEEALRYDASPLLYYNIGVCHHRLHAAAPKGSAAKKRRRDAAISAYNRYLELDPSGSDRPQVEQSIVNLGGVPITQTPLSIERLDPEPQGAPPDLRTTTQWEDDPTDGDPPPADPVPPGEGDDSRPKPPPKVGPVAAVGPFFLIGIHAPGQTADNANVEATPVLGGGLRGGGFLGPKRRIFLGAEFGIGAQPMPNKHGILTGHLGPFVEYAPIVGKARRVLVGGGAMLGIAGQILMRRSGSPTTADCPVSAGRDVSRRGGALAGARFVLGVLLGRKRNHELSLRLTPTLGLWGGGSKRSDSMCEDLPTPFEEFGLDNGAALVMMIDLGYAPRF